ncbi:hypothetical protein AK812_SmicGene24625 [Symbiodinium microadriaticum]|uniref:Ubiquitin-like domain-containing protein n=2 Tax=Symbiodinium TaxID=2949 RepID=A0A1Q9DE71_SYMMI|nr:hypothetical protein AK812_SmicGene24625 [Symbiodinium microadriaticum]
MVSSFALETMVMGSVTSQQIWDLLWQSQQALFILVPCRQMVSSSALDTRVMVSVTSQQIWDQFWQSQQAILILAPCGQMVSSSALDSIGMVSVTSQQIWDQFRQSQQAILSILVPYGQMVSSSALETIFMVSVTSQQIWDQFWQSQQAILILVPCRQMVSSSALDARVMVGVTSQQIWDQFSGSLSHLCCAEGTNSQLVCFGDKFYGKSHVPNRCTGPVRQLTGTNAVAVPAPRPSTVTAQEEAKQRSAAMVQPEWSAAQIAQRICDDMVAKGTLQSKPAFVRQDREKKWVALFEACELDGQRICSCTDPSALDVLIRKKTQGEVWVDNLIASLVSLMPEEVRESRTRCGMRVTVNRMNGDPVQLELSRPCLVRQARAKLAKVFACEETRVALFAGSQVLADRDHAHPEMSMVLMAPKAAEEDQEESESFQAFLEEMKAIFGDIEEMGLEDLTLLLHAVQTAIEDRDENRDNDDWQDPLVLD